MRIEKHGIIISQLLHPQNKFIQISATDGDELIVNSQMCKNLLVEFSLNHQNY